MMRDDMQCMDCEEGVLSEVTYSDTFNFDGVATLVSGLKKLACGVCGASIMAPTQIVANELLIEAARREAKGRHLLSGHDVKVLRERLGITQQQASSIFGGGKNAFSKYERGVVQQSEAMDNLLRLVDRYPGLLDDLREIAGVQSTGRWMTYGKPQLRVVRSDRSVSSSYHARMPQGGVPQGKWRTCAK